MKSKILVLYHFFHPDDVVSAQQFTGLAEGLTSKNWEVEAWPSNRACHPPAPTIAIPLRLTSLPLSYVGQATRLPTTPPGLRGTSRGTGHLNKNYGMKVEMLEGVKVKRVWGPSPFPSDIYILPLIPRNPGFDIWKD